MKKFIIVMMIMVTSLFMVGCCQEEAPKPTLNPEGVENIITETILYEDVTTYWD